MRRLIVLRPEPGGSRTAQRAAALGFDVRRVPLFDAIPIAWAPPAPLDFDAVLLTSAQAVVMAGSGLLSYRDLPAYAVGAATAAALRDTGFATVIAGDGDGSAIAARIARDGHRTVLHLTGETVAALDPGPLQIRRIAVYTMIETDVATLAPAIETPAILLVHSPRAGQRIAKLIRPEQRNGLHMVAISPAACAAAGAGWASALAASMPQDDAMLALALDLCK